MSIFRSQIVREKRRCRSEILVIIFLTFFIIHILIDIFDEENHEPRDGFVLEKDAVKDVLKTTPYLWRKNPQEETEPVRQRVENQRQWIQSIAGLLKFHSKNVKTIWLDGSRFYNTSDRINCPYAPDFENKCLIRPIPWNWYKFFGPYRYGGMGAFGDALVEKRDWVSRHPINPPTVDNRFLHVVYLLEPPWIAKGADFGDEQTILASYWRGSDIPIPYGILEAVEENKTRTAFSHNFLKTKTKSAAVIVSNCRSTERLNYIQELEAEGLSIDLYGRCGSKPCRGDCRQSIEKEYKFYLSFENSRCEDYITEKFFENGLEFNILPIAWGARPSDYREAAPSKSYIHVEDFPSTRELVNYLKYLEGNETAYLEYFKWKAVKYKTMRGAWIDFFCRVCGMLYYADFVPPPIWGSKKGKNWRDFTKCLEPGDKGWGESPG